MSAHFVADEAEGHTNLSLSRTQFITQEKPFPAIVGIGKRGSGKTVSSVGIVEELGKPRVVCFCGTEDSRAFWANALDSYATVHRVDEKGMQEMIRIREEQEQIVLEYKALKQPVPEEWHMTLIFDDVAENPEFLRSKHMSWWFSNGRHARAAVLVLLQFATKITPSMRENADKICLFWNGKKNLKAIHDCYIDEPSNFDLFVALCKKITGRTTVDAEGNVIPACHTLVYDTNQRSDDMSDMYSVYVPPPFEVSMSMKLGDSAWRAYNIANFVDVDRIQIQKRLRERRLQNTLKNFRVTGQALNEEELEELREAQKPHFKLAPKVKRRSQVPSVSVQYDFEPDDEDVETSDEEEDPAQFPYVPGQPGASSFDPRYMGTGSHPYSGAVNYPPGTYPTMGSAAYPYSGTGMGLYSGTGGHPSMGSAYPHTGAGSYPNVGSASYPYSTNGAYMVPPMTEPNYYSPHPHPYPSTAPQHGFSQHGSFPHGFPPHGVSPQGGIGPQGYSYPTPRPSVPSYY